MLPRTLFAMPMLRFRFRRFRAADASAFALPSCHTNNNTTKFTLPLFFFALMLLRHDVISLRDFSRFAILMPIAPLMLRLLFAMLMPLSLIALCYATHCCHHTRHHEYAECALRCH